MSNTTGYLVGAVIGLWICVLMIGADLRSNDKRITKLEQVQR